MSQYNIGYLIGVATGIVITVAAWSWWPQIVAAVAR